MRTRRPNLASGVLHRICSAATVAAVVLALAPASSAAPVAMRYPEGPAHGFVVLSDLAGKALAYGELVQHLERAVVVSRLTILFTDRSIYDETVRFTQHPVFRLESYRLVQRGPSFTEATTVRFSRAGHYRVRRRATPHDEEERAGGRMVMPDDLTNGMTSIMLKNLPDGGSATTHMVVFNPRPRVLEVEMTRDGADRYWIGSASHNATRFRITPRVTGATGVLATLAGKQPPAFHMWIAQGKAPTLVRFEGPLYADGPTWRTELTGPRWAR